MEKLRSWKTSNEAPSSFCTQALLRVEAHTHTRTHKVQALQYMYVHRIKRNVYRGKKRISETFAQ